LNLKRPGPPPGAFIPTYTAPPNRADDIDQAVLLRSHAITLYDPPMPGPDIKLRAATDHIHAGRLEQARVLLARILQHAPDSVDANSMMCFVLIHQGQADSALYYARRADQLAPNDPNLLNNLGNGLMLAGDFDAAADAYGRAHALDRSHVSSLIGLTNALNCRHRYGESEDHCRQALGHPSR
jgi:type IV pilus assembly protein PilF